METPSPAESLLSRVDDGRSGFDAPIRDALLRLGYLSQEQTARVVSHQAERNLDFDQAALELGFITTDDLDNAREQLITSMALHDTGRRDVSDQLTVVTDPSSVRAEAIRLLRTQINAQHLRVGRRGLAMVSAVGGAGCSYLAANLAASLAQVGTKTLLIDANMRTPAAHSYFGLDRDAPGLSSFLSLAVARPERVVHANVLPSLSVITAGPDVPRPQELLSGRRFRDGVNMLLREYDLVIFDTPPTNANADALTIGAAAGYALVVARRNLSYFNDVSVLVGQLAAARCPVIGSVLNEF
jgi:receptor protein-tyrosine kinase